jgi:lipopolysaccharide transport system permease protein
LKLGELWEFRELLVLMAWRDLRIRYKQTILGVMWAVLPTLFAGLIFSIIFGRLARLGSEGLPYPVFYFTAVVPWNFFSNILTHASTCLTGNSNILHKVYFPRLILPLKTVLVALVDFMFACSLIVGSMIYYDLAPSPNVGWLAFYFLLAMLTGLGMGLWFSGLNAYFRDVGMFLPFFTQIWFFLTPIFYSSTLYPEPWQMLSRLNPMASVATGFRWALFGVGQPPDLMVGLAFLMALGLTISGAFFFKRVERTIVDII